MDLKDIPKRCPDCKGKVREFSINVDGDKVVMCEKEQCPWPFRPKDGLPVKFLTENKEVEDEDEDRERTPDLLGTPPKKKRGVEKFEKVVVREEKSVDEMLKKVVKNNKKLGKKKYRGFGELTPVNDEKPPKIKKVKKATVPLEEAGIITELLSAVKTDKSLVNVEDKVDVSLKEEAFGDFDVDDFLDSL